MKKERFSGPRGQPRPGRNTGQRPLRRGIASWLTIGVAVAAVLLVLLRPWTTQQSQRLLIAPILQGLDLCDVEVGVPSPRSLDELAAYCRATGRSAAKIVEAKLAEWGPPVTANGKFEIGYTLPLPLLKLLHKDGLRWTVDQRAIERIVLMIHETERPVILYLFSTHFSADAPIEGELFKDPTNVAVSNAGPMNKDTYYGTDIFPWTVASTDNSLTRYRQLVIEQVLKSICRTAPSDRRKIRAITLLGELHHFHADFQRGMAIGGGYIVSDYSEVSIREFRTFLKQQFGTIDALSSATGETFAHFGEVDPPSKDIRTAQLRRFTEHIDSFAHGKIPLVGWAFDPGHRGEPVWIRVYRNGEQIARVPARYSRQDVLQARPAFGTADVGWRFDLDFTDLQPGIHRLDFLAEQSGGRLVSIGSREVAIAARDKLVASELPVVALPEVAAGSSLEAHVDHPQGTSTYYFNPLAPLWHKFRNAQIVRYLAHFERQIHASCLRDSLLFTHQITPFTNPSWDTTKYAVDASLRGAANLDLGISLYGEPTYGTSFFDWLAGVHRPRYGLTEFHPLRDMSREEVRSMLDAHRQRGARFLSFFVDARPPEMRTESALNVFTIDPRNPHFGSDRLAETFKAVFNE